MHREGASLSSGQDVLITEFPRREFRVLMHLSFAFSAQRSVRTDRVRLLR